MGQIFWKFLAAFWAALLLAGALVWGAGQVSRYYSDDDQNSGMMMVSPAMRMVLQSMQVLLEQGDFQTLELVLKKWDQEAMAKDKVLLINRSGSDYLQRPVPENWPQLLAAQRQMWPDDSQSDWQFLIVPRHDSVLEWFKAVRGSLEHRPDLGPQRPHGDFESPAKPDALHAGGAQGQPEHGFGRPPEDGGPPARFKPPFWWHPLFLFSAVVLTSLGVSLALAWYFASPVRQLKLALQSLAKDRWLTQLGPAVTGRGDEFGALARSFNLMAQSVEQAIGGQQRLLHDVSHELRSPLARLQLLVALGRQTPEETPMLLDKVEAETVKLDRLVGEILTFSRLDSGAMPVTQYPIDLVELIESVVDNSQLEADAKAVQIQTHLPTEMVLNLDPELVARAVENLLRNAVKFSPNGGSVEVQLVTQQGCVCLSIVDQGPGVDEADLVRLGLPFFRANPQQPGVGLGLSIAVRAIESCAGRLELSNKYNQQGQRSGFCARIHLHTS